MFVVFGSVPKNHHPSRLLPISFSPLADVVFYAKFLALPPTADAVGYSQSALRAWDAGRFRKCRTSTPPQRKRFEIDFNQLLRQPAPYGRNPGFFGKLQMAA